jgi:hypothetical protein
MGEDFDLRSVRDLVKDAILNAGLYPQMHETFSVRSDLRLTADFLHQQVQKADVFIGIYARQYGFVPELDERGQPNIRRKSTVEMEYEWAVEKGIPCLFYMLKEDGTSGLFSQFVENEPKASQVSEFKKRIKSQHYIGEFATLDTLINQYIKDDLNRIVKTLDERNRNRLDSTPVFGPPKDAGQWSQVFVLMPFGKNLEHSREIFDNHIFKTADRLGLSCKRGDDFYTNESIINEIWSAIYHARVCIADCTGRNPNVFYEIGIAHTLGRECILISQEDVPFDLEHIRRIPYEYTPHGMAKLEEVLERTLKNILNL